MFDAGAEKGGEMGRQFRPVSERLSNVGELMSISLSIQAPRRPLAPSISGPADLGAVIWLRAALKPERLGDIDLLLPKEPFRGSRIFRVGDALNGSRWLTLVEDGPALEGDDSDRFRKNDEDGDVVSFGRLGFGTGRGFKYLSSGFMVRYSELVELTLPSRLRFPEPI